CSSSEVSSSSYSDAWSSEIPFKRNTRRFALASGLAFSRTPSSQASTYGSPQFLQTRSGYQGAPSSDLTDFPNAIPVQCSGSLASRRRHTPSTPDAARWYRAGSRGNAPGVDGFARTPTDMRDAQAEC